MKESSTNDANHSKGPHNEESFKGYTLDELKYQRALLLLKKEYLREKMNSQIADVKKRVPLLNGGSSISGLSSSGMVRRVMKGLNFADYLMLGFSMFNAGRKVVSLFKRKK